jgi:hypothetical protein
MSQKGPGFQLGRLPACGLRRLPAYKVALLRLPACGMRLPA